MSDAIIVAMIAGFAGILANLIATFRNGRKHDAQAVKIAEIHLDTNGRLTTLTQTNALLVQKVAHLEKLLGAKKIGLQPSRKVRKAR